MPINFFKYLERAMVVIRELELSPYEHRQKKLKEQEAAKAKQLAEEEA